MSLVDERDAFSQTIVRQREILVCPACAGSLKILQWQLSVECVDCGRSFRIDSGVPLLFWPNEWDSREDVTEIVRRFYEENPFPNYEGTDSKWSLKQKAERGVFARMLDSQIRYGARILEVGCGTGQLSNFLGLRWGRAVFGTDICLNSLRLGEEFRKRNGINNVGFCQMNLFKPVFRHGSFDVVICNGVLHHTSDPFLGFQSIVRLVKAGGYILIGLYNKYGRIPTDLRRHIFRATGNRLTFLDPRLRERNLGGTRRRAWFLDQYRHPHESKHTIEEVLAWFDRTGVRYVNSIPKAVPFTQFSKDEQIFQPSPRGSSLEHLLVEMGMLLSGGSEGGFFVMIGLKNGSQREPAARDGEPRER